MLGNELGDARLAVGRLDQLDPPLCVAEEDHANALIRQVADRLGVKSERVAEERERVIEAWDGDRDVMQRAESHRRGGT